MIKELENQEELTVLMCMVCGEARGEPINGQIAVAWTARNRSKDGRWPKTIKEVCLQPKQFSCFNESDLNLSKIISDFKHWRLYEDWRLCRWSAAGVLYGYVPDYSRGANHYHVKDMKKVPNWADHKKMTVIIGNHVFYAL